jgi:predicted solute-binding protein
MSGPGDTHTLRLGYHHRVNFAPLLYPLEAGWVGAESPWLLQVVDQRHKALAESLLAGDLDAAFIAPADAQKWGSKITPLGGWGLACAGASETAILLAPRRIDLIDGESVAISPLEEGSAADHLLRTLIAPYYGVTLNVSTQSGEGHDRAVARLVFGDEAVREGEAAKAKGEVAEDVGLAWWILTGLPVVWEVLCYRRDLDARKPGATAALQAAIRLSQRSATEQASSVVDVAAAGLNLNPNRLKEMFARQTYTLGPNEQKGLATLLDMAGRAKAI